MNNIVEVEKYPKRLSRKPFKRAPGGLKRAVAKRKKPKKVSLTSLSKKADKTFSAYIRARDKKCVRCGWEGKSLQCSHFWPRAISSTRYDPENCDTLCYGCHYGDRLRGWEYAKQGEYRDFKIKQLGEERYKNLALRATIIVKRQEAIQVWHDLLHGISVTDQSSDSATTAEPSS